MSAENINFYSSNTTANLEERIRIQTLTLKSLETSSAEEDPKAMLIAQITSYIKLKPDSYVAGSTTKCENDSCVIKVKFCDSSTEACEDVSLNPIPRPGGGLITSREAQRTSSGQLLWSDLEGKPKQTTIDTWLKKNNYGCTVDSPFVEDAKKVSP